MIGFTVLYLVQKARGTTSISAFHGLGKSNPFLAFAMTLALLSMAGIPPLAGFMAKYYVFANAFEQGFYWFGFVCNCYVTCWGLLLL